MTVPDRCKQRRHLTLEELRAFLDAAARADGATRGLCEMLVFTGARLSELLELRVSDVDFDQAKILLVSMKQRRQTWRLVPAPLGVLEALDRTHGLREAVDPTRRLWPWSRITAWRRVRAVFAEAGVAPGPHATPNGLRRSYAMSLVEGGASMDLVARLMGHSTLASTAEYFRHGGDADRRALETVWQAHRFPGSGR